MAGEPLVQKIERANAVRPPKGRTDKHLMPMEGDESGDLEAEEDKEECGADEEEIQSQQQK